MLLFFSIYFSRRCRHRDAVNRCAFDIVVNYKFLVIFFILLYALYFILYFLYFCFVVVLLLIQPSAMDALLLPSTNNLFWVIFIHFEWKRVIVHYANRLPKINQWKRTKNKLNEYNWKLRWDGDKKYREKWMNKNWMKKM